jgi:type I restriction enzyme S subunit
VKDLVFPLPSLKTQQRIAGILDDASALCDKTAQLLKEYDLLAQSIFLEMFGDPVLNEKKWEVKRLEKVCVKITDGTHQGPKFRTEGIPFLLVSNIVNNEVIYETKKFIDDEEYTKLTKSTKIEVGDLLYTSVGSYGNPAIVKDVRKFCFQRHIAHIKVKSELINVTFLHAMMKSPLIKRQADRFAVGAAQKTLNLKTIRNFEIFHPPLDKQNQFAEKISLIEQQKKLAKQELQESEDLFNCLLQKAFKGELV